VKLVSSLKKRSSKQQISWPLAEIINLSIQKVVFPSKLKHAKVVPIYKTDDETDPGNYSLKN
jgi:hypothetical protein